MKASRSSVRCGVVEMYCCQTCWAISAAEELDFRVAGPEERVAGVDAAGAEVVEAACRLAGMVVELGWVRWWCEADKKPEGIPVSEAESYCISMGIRGRSESQWRGEEDQLMPAGSFVIGQVTCAYLMTIVQAELLNLKSCLILFELYFYEGTSKDVFHINVSIMLVLFVIVPGCGGTAI